MNYFSFPNGMNRAQWDYIVRESYTETCATCKREIPTGVFRSRLAGKIVCWRCQQAAKKAAAKVPDLAAKLPDPPRPVEGKTSPRR